MLALGAALGGLATEWLGIRTVFVLDSLSYCLSAWFIWRTTIPPSGERAASAGRRSTAFADIFDGWRHMRRDPRIGRIALTKSAWALGGGAQIYMLTLLGEQLAPAAPGIGIGLLYAARGLGTGVGPVAARAWVPRQDFWPTLLGLGIIASGLIYSAVGWAPWSYGILALVMLGHMPSGANWTLSTVLLQQRTEDRYRGRVFATEWLLLTLTDTVAILAVSLLLESGLLTLRQGISGCGAVQVMTGLLWLATVVPQENRESRRGSDGDPGPTG